MNKLLIACAGVALAVLTGVPAASAKGPGGGKGHQPSGSAGIESVSVPPSAYATAATATVSTSRTSAQVSTICYLDGKPVYTGLYPVVDGQATTGVLSSVLWPRSAADCTAELGYVSRDGMGRWTVTASTTFTVSA